MTFFLKVSNSGHERWGLVHSSRQVREYHVHIKRWHHRTESGQLFHAFGYLVPTVTGMYGVSNTFEYSRLEDSRRVCILSKRVCYVYTYTYTVCVSLFCWNSNLCVSYTFTADCRVFYPRCLMLVYHIIHSRHLNTYLTEDPVPIPSSVTSFLSLA
jgi:hypothetical protein